MKERMEEIELSLAKAIKQLEFETSSILLEKKGNQDLSCYYKLPMFFFETHKNDLAKGTLDFIYEKFLMSDGDFRTKNELKSIKPEYVVYWSYFNGWILRAAYLLQHNLPEPSLNYFKSLYLGEGRFFSHAPNNISEGTTDVLTVAHHGLFYLQSECDELANEAVKFLYQAFDKQSELNKRFLLRFDNHNQPIDKYETDQQMFFSIDRNHGKDQLYFMMAYPCAFLGLYYRKTRNKTALDYAKHYMDFILNCDEAIYLSRFSHKTAWAASILYAETEDPTYLESVYKIVNYFRGIQSDDGLWFKEEGPCVYLDQSAEIGCWFSEILKNIQRPQLEQNKNTHLSLMFDPSTKGDKQEIMENNTCGSIISSI